ncbi:S8 family serine peptidase [Chryseomicrobium imtechense]
MNKAKAIVMSGLLALSMAGSMTSVAAAEVNVNANGGEKIRVLIEASASSGGGVSTMSQSKAQLNSAKATYGKRWEFANGNSFSTEMTEKQFAALQKNKNLKVTKVDQVTVAADLRAAKKPGTVQTTAQTPTQQVPWGIKSIYNNNNLASTSGGGGINIAVLDTGVNVNHIDLVNTVEQCKDFTTAAGLTNGQCNDANGHGTHVAGSALADGGSDKLGLYGVAPDSDLWAYKVLGDNGSGYSDDIAAAIRHAADQATATRTKTVINMSLGSSANNSLISSAVDYAYGKGVLVVAAAGNSGPAQGSIGYPGALRNAIAVAALENRLENGTLRVADFSSRGFTATDGDYVIGVGDVEISAPGAAIYSTWNNGGYNTISGTSMASPHVAGLAAKVWAQNPTWTAATLRTNLQNRARANDILGGRGAAVGDDYASGFGYARVQ